MLASLPVNFLLYTALSTTDYELIQFDGCQVIPRLVTLWQVTLAEGSRFDPGRGTKVVVHGWGGGLHLDEYFNSAYAESGADYNVIGVDWREMEGRPQEQVEEVGRWQHEQGEHTSHQVLRTLPGGSHGVRPQTRGYSPDRLELWSPCCW